MEIDVGNALANVATPGVSRDALDRLDRRVARAHERIDGGRAERQHGYAALALPEEVDTDAIRSVTDAIPTASHVILVGIGGSALGAATIAEALGAGDRLHVLDHLDPVETAATLEAVPFEDAVVHVVSRSGQTTETLANAMVVVDAMETAGVDWRERTMVTTGAEGPLRALVERHGLPVLPVPAGVPGRYAALSTVGLPAVHLLGLDIESLLAGGQSAVEDLSPSLYDSPAYAFGATSYALTLRGAQVNAMMPYSERLERFAEWFAQLWAESLGKDRLGQVPTRALGVTDQHSQLQLYRAGPRNVQVSFLAVDEHADREIGRTHDADILDADHLVGRTLGELMETERLATEASLAAAGCPSVRLEIERLDEHSLGALLTGMEAACMMAGELFGVDTFVQPGVEWSKRATAGLLKGESTPETEAIADKSVLRIS